MSIIKCWDSVYRLRRVGGLGRCVSACPRHDRIEKAWSWSLLFGRNAKRQGKWSRFFNYLMIFTNVLTLGGTTSQPRLKHDLLTHRVSRVSSGYDAGYTPKSGITSH